MKEFKGPRKQGGWVALAATAAAAIYKGYSDKKAAKSAQDANKDLSKEGFARQTWLDQQARKYQLEDRKYKEDAMGGFKNAGPYTAANFPDFQAPAPTTTTGLADWNPENGVPGLMNIPIKAKK